MENPSRAHVVISGRVQGVGFRYATQREAERLGLSGWVRNLYSGEVEAVFEGNEPALREMIEWCREGPAGSYVAGVRVVPDEPIEGCTGFRVRRTAATAEI